MSLSAWEQLMLLKEQTNRTGMLHEAQVLQLKMAPLVLFAKSTKSSFGINIDSKRIVFTITMGKRLPQGLVNKPLGPKEAATTLDDLTKRLLGDDWDVEIRVGSGQTFRSFEFPGVLDVGTRTTRTTEVFEEGRREPPHSS